MLSRLLQLACVLFCAACGRVGIELLDLSESEQLDSMDASVADAELADAEVDLPDVAFTLDAGPACELDNLANCGACGRACDPAVVPNVDTMQCREASCAVESCLPGFGDCDGVLENGCERQLDTLLECGTCGTPCALPHAVTSCESGSCVFVSCETGFGDCDGVLENGCETETNSLEHCGACDALCQLPAPATSSCTGGRCTSASCAAPFADCDSDPATCEANLRSLTHCGACGVTCGSNGRLAHASATCSTGSCGIGACDANWGNCDNSASNGCERSLTTLSDCGACGRSCALSHATASCSTGSCTLSGCLAGWGNCDNNNSNGCEAALDTNTNCGGCGIACSATQTCQAGRCVGQFNYPPGNVNPGALNPGSRSDATLNCGASQFNTTTLAFTNWCGTPPTPVVQAQSGGLDLVILAVRDFTLAAGASLRVVGNRPLAIVAFGNVTLTGSIDVSASGSVPGPGGNLSCGASQGGNGSGSSSSGGGGGGGAGHGTQGGSGGYGDSSGNQGARGTARGAATLTPLLAGCAGGQGGGCSAARAAGGGALQISATGRLEAAGPIRALGADGAAGCGSEGGGNGGGSGGAILLEGEQLIVRASAQLNANGGRGGNGSGGGSGGSGGTGSSASQNGGSDGTNGGGGGGGAFGRIRLRGRTQCTLTAAASPGATTACP